jgi:hypothetical protein
MPRRQPSIGAKPLGSAVAGGLVLPVVRYAANELQNADAIARLFTHKPVLRLPALAVMIVLWVAAFASLVYLIGVGRGHPRPADLIAMTMRALIAMLGRGNAGHNDGFPGACCEA